MRRLSSIELIPRSPHSSSKIDSQRERRSSACLAPKQAKNIQGALVFLSKAGVAPVRTSHVTLIKAGNHMSVFPYHFKYLEDMAIWKAKLLKEQRIG